jgi:hypothetical protein
MNFFLMACLALAATAYAGEKGNGGDVVVCHNPDGSVRSAELYDYVEARFRDGRTINLGDPGQTVEEMVETVLARIQRLDTTRALLYRGWLRDFFAEAKFIAGVELTDIPDTGDAILPVGCALRQLVAQMNDPFRPRQRYVISKDYWDLLDNSSKAGTILHEFFLREFATDFGHENSRVARFFNGLFSDPAVAELAWVHYLTLARHGAVLLTGGPYGGAFRIGTRLSWQPWTNGLGYTIKNARSSVPLLLPIDGANEIAELEYGLEYFLSGGAPAAVELGKAKKVSGLTGGWEIANTHVCLGALNNGLTVIGGRTGTGGAGYELRHPEIIPKGCLLQLVATDLEDHFPYDERFACQRPRLTSPLGRACHVSDFEVAFLISTSVELKLRDESGLADLYPFIGTLRLPYKHIRISKLTVQLNAKRNTILDVTTYGYSQKILNARRREIEVPKNSVITLSEEGLVLTCRTSAGRNCYR